jgi:curved DNA-binding protein CbpA
MSRTLHPDRRHDNQHEKFLILGDANNILNDPARRTEIDNTIAKRLKCLDRYNQYPEIQEKAYAQYVNAEGKGATLAIVLDSVVAQFLEQDFDSFHNQPATPTQPAASSTRDGTRSARTNNAATNNTNTNNNGRGRGGTRHA